MSQYDFGTIDPYVVDGVQLADMLNQFRTALNSMHRGAARPAYAVPGMMWINDSGGATNWILNVYLGASGDKPLFGYNTTTGAVSVLAVTGGPFTAAQLYASGPVPLVGYQKTDNPVDQKWWRTRISGTGTMIFETLTDAGVATTRFEMLRDGTVIAANSAWWPTNTTAQGILGANVPLPTVGTFTPGPNTGAIGAAGQKWMIMAHALISQTAGAYSYYEARIWDGAAQVGPLPNFTSVNSGHNAAVTLVGFKTLAAATTFTLQAKPLTGTTGSMLAQSSIEAVRLS